MVSTESLRLSLIQKLASTEDEYILAQIKELLEEPQPISIEQYNREIEEAEARIEAGEYATHEEVKKEMRSWLKK